jgi:hypothetical protein
MRLLVVLLTLVLLSSCSNNTISKTRPLLINPENDTHEFMDAFFSKELKLSIHEPQSGAYLGSYILANKALDFSIKNFENKVIKKHSLYLYNMIISESVPMDFILQCIANKSTPYIIISPDNTDDPYDYTHLESLAKEFSKLYIPIFVELYPVLEQKIEAKEYQAYFRYASSMFKKYAQNISLVWSVSTDSLYGSSRLYPGDDYVNFVGLSHYIKNDTGTSAVYDFFNKMDYFYYTYQKTKPILISKLGISHYSTDEHKYFSKESAQTLVNIYESVILKYPRVKGINYMNFNGVDIMGILERNVQDFSITEDETMLEAYKEVIQNKEYLSSIEINNVTGPQLIRSPFKAVRSQGVYYVSEKSLIYDMDARIISIPIPYKKTFDGEYYVSLDFLTRAKIVQSYQQHQNKLMISVD